MRCRKQQGLRSSVPLLWTKSAALTSRKSAGQEAHHGELDVRHHTTPTRNYDSEDRELATQCAMGLTHQRHKPALKVFHGF